MVADRVVIDTLSYKEGAKAGSLGVRGRYGICHGQKAIRQAMVRGITLYLNEDSNEFCNEYRAREVIQKYCAFMPVEIFLDNASAEPQYEQLRRMS